jgi:hypothetical protein
MVQTGLRRSRNRRRAVEPVAAAAARYAAMGWPVCAGAYPPVSNHPGLHQYRRPQYHEELTRSCSCDRMGCPAPGAHPVSPAWQVEATADPAVVGQWWAVEPRANVILVTGRLFDVLDVPLAAAAPALALMEQAAVEPGPVGIAGSRALFFVATRGRPADEGEWWSCRLDCEPETVSDSGLRWHCRDSYVLAPPSSDGGGMRSHWLRPPAASPLPDALRLLEFLADACEGNA